NVSLVIGYAPTKDFNCLAGTKGTDDQWPDGSIVARPNADLPGLMDHTYLASHPNAILLPSGADVRSGSASEPAVNQGYALHLDNKSSGEQGEPWDDVVANGDGFYAHAEEILGADGGDTGMVNIEYTVAWPYNSGECSYHHGDLTTMTVVYDRKSDLISRLSYSAHGVVLQIFQIAPAPQVRVVTLTGLDDHNNTQTVRAALVLMQVLFEKGDDHFTPGDGVVYLAEDPVTSRFEHPVAYAEYNSHEFWPNTGGRELTVAQHSGNGFSFLASKKIEDLGTVESPNANDAPFLFFNGAWGTDPRPVMQHNTWYWPKGRAKNPYGITKFTDPDPYGNYVQNGELKWPPDPAWADLSGAIEYVDPDGKPDGFALFNSTQSPFSDLNTALSFAPKGGTVIFVRGDYPAPRYFDRPTTLRALAPVTFGR
ncbi:MAG: hypothetical protein ABI129_00990, partial [Rhodanobacter sp.]